jgi:hypothetical protein
MMSWHTCNTRHLRPTWMLRHGYGWIWSFSFRQSAGYEACLDDGRGFLPGLDSTSVDVWFCVPLETMIICLVGRPEHTQNQNYYQPPWQHKLSFKTGVDDFSSLSLESSTAQCPVVLLYTLGLHPSVLVITWRFMDNNDRCLSICHIYAKY